MSVWKKLKDFVGIEDGDDYYEENNYDQSEKETKEETKEDVKYESNKQNKIKEDVSYNSNNVNYQKKYDTNEDMVVTIKEPLSYEDAKSIIDDVKNGKTVVLNLQMLEVDKKNQVFYFVSGGVYALEGTIQEVTRDIYVLVPKGVDFDGKVKNTIKNKTLYQIN